MRQIALEQRQPAPLDLSEQTITSPAQQPAHTASCVTMIDIQPTRLWRLMAQSTDAALSEQHRFIVVDRDAVRALKSTRGALSLGVRVLSLSRYARRSTLRLCPRALVMPLAERLSTVSLAFAGGIRAGHGLILRAELAKEHD